MPPFWSGITLAPKSILIVDDSATYRHQLRLAMAEINGINVVGEASTGQNALQFMKYNHVDCMTLDIEMPGMTGIEVVTELRKFNQTCKVIMFSSLSTKGAEATLKALHAGADDFVTKPKSDSFPASMSPSQIIKSVIEPKISSLLSQSTTGSRILDPAPIPRKDFDWRLFRPKVIVIGSSTGGPVALERLFSAISWPLICPVFIAQHMPEGFTQALAQRLSVTSNIKVSEAHNDQAITSNDVILAPGNYHLTLHLNSDGILVSKLDQRPHRNFVRPAVDYLFESAADAFGSRCMGIVLTGMGHDGKEGAEQIKRKLGSVAIQDKNSCVVFGMPGAVMAANSFDVMGNLGDLATLINRVASTK